MKESTLNFIQQQALLFYIHTAVCMEVVIKTRLTSLYYAIARAYHHNVEQ